MAGSAERWFVRADGSGDVVPFSPLEYPNSRTGRQLWSHSRRRAELAGLPCIRPNSQAVRVHAAVDDSDNASQDRSQSPPRDAWQMTQVSVREAQQLRDTMRGIWRGDLDGEVAGQDAEKAELASYRLACNRAAIRSSRDRAGSWREDRKKELKVVLRMKAEEAAAEGFDELAGDESEASPEAPLSIRRQTRSSATDPEKESSRRESARENATLRGRTAVAGKAGRKVTVRPKQPLEERLRKVKQLGKERMRQAMKDEGLDPESEDGFCTIRRAKSRSMHVANVEKLFMTKGLRGENEAIRSVFALYDRDKSGTLGAQELRKILAELGLRGKNESERHEIRKILQSSENNEVDCEEFASTILPAVRAKLNEMTRDRNVERFRDADVDKSGLLSINEMVRALRLMGTFPSEEQVCQAIMDIAPDIAERCATFEGTWMKDKDVMDLERFCLTIPLLQERKSREDRTRFLQIATELNFGEDERAEWSHNLADLHDAFHRANAGASPEAALRLMQAKSLLFRQPKGLLSAPGMVKEAFTKVSRAEDFDFKAFMRLAGELRKHDSQRLATVFKKCDMNMGGSLSLLETQHALRECEIVAKSQAEQDAIKAAIDDYDEDDSGELSRTEFISLCRHVGLKLQNLRREEQRLSCLLQFEWDDEEFENVRQAFDNLDFNLNGTLERDEVLRAAEFLKPGASREESAKLLVEHGLMNPANAQVDFGLFCKLMHSIEAKGAASSATKRAEFAAGRY